jgi:hypothetical protein
MCKTLTVWNLLLLFLVLVFYFCLSEPSHTICGMNKRLKAERERTYEKNDVLFQKLVIQFMELA